jgi:hypothetical protein
LCHSCDGCHSHSDDNHAWMMENSLPLSGTWLAIPQHLMIGTTDRVILQQIGTNFDLGFPLHVAS